LSRNREDLEARLIEAFLAREGAGADRPPEVDEDPSLAAFARDLARLEVELSTLPEPDAPESLVARSLALGRAELRPTTPRAVALQLGRLVLAAALPLAAVLLTHLLLVLYGPGVIAGWLPDFLPRSLATALPWVYAIGAAGWLALLLGSLPTLAHRTAARHPQEVPA
jgi:hypothetical protein